MTNRVLVVQGAGMDRRGHDQVELFGPDTLEEIDTRIRGAAADLDLDVEILQSNDEPELVSMLAEIESTGFVAGLINPAGFTTTTGPLPASNPGWGESTLSFGIGSFAGFRPISSLVEKLQRIVIAGRDFVRRLAGEIFGIHVDGAGPVLRWADFQQHE